MHPVFLEFQSFEIRWYGILIGMAFLAGTGLAVREAGRKGFDRELIYDFLFYALLAGIFSARLYFLSIFDPSIFGEHPGEILAIWNGGLSIQGGLLGGLIAGILFCRARRISFWDFADLLTPSVILGQAVGRVACVLNGCSFGKPTLLPWAVTFTDPRSAAPRDIPLHPTQFYEMGADLLIFLLVWNLRKRTRFGGELFLIWAMAYGGARIFLEMFRGDSLLITPNLPAARLFGLASMAAAAGLFLWRRARTTAGLQS